MTRKKLNKKRILSNIAEARQELQDIESKIKSGKKFDEMDFEFVLRHACHHLNFAWNTRHVKTREYKNLSDKNFEKWGRFPVGMDTLIW